MHFAVHLDDAAVFVDNLFTDPQSEPSSDCTFSREKRLEDVLPQIRTEGVGNGYPDPAST
jgi:hypothetical protein